MLHQKIKKLAKFRLQHLGLLSFAITFYNLLLFTIIGLPAGKVAMLQCNYEKNRKDEDIGNADDEEEDDDDDDDYDEKGRILVMLVTNKQCLQ